MKRDMFAEAVAVLTVMRKYDSELPNPAKLFEMKPRKQLELRKVLALVESIDVLTDDLYSRLCEALSSALPADWPGNVASFARHFHEIVHGQKPTIKTMTRGEDGELGDMKLVEAAATGPTYTA